MHMSQTNLNVVIRAATRVLIVVIMGSMLIAFAPGEVLAQEAAPDAQTARDPAKLQQLVAPIALYPDELIAQILAASTYPVEIVQANRWLQQHSKLQGEQLAVEVDRESWDPSVKALTAFPSVLANLDKNLSWTSELGEAYFNQQQDVLDAVQVLRKRAQDAGTLKTTPQERVVVQGPEIIIEPVDREVCYLPIYDPWLAYGAPIGVYPGYFYDSWFGPPYISFAAGINLGYFGGFGWGWPAWGFNWGRRVVVFNHNTYFSRSRFFSRGFPGNGRGNFGGGRSGNSFYSNRDFRGFDRNRTNGIPNRNFNQGRSITNLDRGRSNGNQGSGDARRVFRGFPQARPDMRSRTGNFSGFGDHNSPSRGRSTFGQASGSTRSFGGGSNSGSGRSFGSGHGFGGGRSSGGSRSGGGGRGGGGGRHR